MRRSCGRVSTTCNQQPLQPSDRTPVVPLPSTERLVRRPFPPPHSSTPTLSTLYSPRATPSTNARPPQPARKFPLYKPPECLPIDVFKSLRNIVHYIIRCSSYLVLDVDRDVITVLPQLMPEGIGIVRNRPLQLHFSSLRNLMQLQLLFVNVLFKCQLDILPLRPCIAERAIHYVLDLRLQMRKEMRNESRAGGGELYLWVCGSIGVEGVHVWVGGGEDGRQSSGESGRQDGSDNSGELAKNDVADGLGLEVCF
jgi:hypothetical protein